jgi:hypothetical protein
MPSHRPSFCWLALCFVLFSLAGCNKGLGTLPVTGKVFYQGKPLAEGTVIYAPVDVNGRQARGAIQPDGTFALTTGAEEGAMPGEYQVVIEAYAPHPGEPGRGETPSDATPAPIVRGYIVPEQYTIPEKTPFKDTVDGDHPGYKEWKIE